MSDAASTVDGTATTWAGRLQLSLRWLVIAAGLLAVGTAILVVIRPATARLLPVAAIRATLGSDYAAVAVIGLVAVGCGLLALSGRLRRGVTEVTPPVVEGVQSATYPGATVDRTAGRSLLAATEASDSAGGDSTDAPTETRRRLRQAAIAATQAAKNCSQEAARRRVDDGSWTTDTVASAWLAADESGSGPTGSTATASPASERTVARTVSAITERRRSEGSQ